MFKQEFEKFEEILGDVAGLYGKSLSTNQTVMYFRALIKYTLQDVQAAINGHVSDPERGRFMPLPADIIAKAEKCFAVNDGRPTAEQAWAIAINAADERNTVVWTDETAQAWNTVSCFYGDGRVSSTNEYNASRAFKDTYDRLVAENRANRVMALWIVGQGWDKDLRSVAIEQALSQNLITQAQAAPMLTYHQEPAGDIIAAISGSVVHRIGLSKDAQESLDRVASLRDAGEKHQAGLAALHAALNAKSSKPKQEALKNPVDNLRIFEQAESAGVFIDREDKKMWLEKAGSGECLSVLQARIFEKRAQRKAGAA